MITLWKGSGLMRVAQEKVETFMEKIGDVVETTPVIGDVPSGVRRQKLMEEELMEYGTALRKGDLIGIADGLGDLIYTVLGTAAHHGINLEPIFEEIHRSNMTKDRDHSLGYKLCRKGEGYTPPNLAPLLLLMAESFQGLDQ